MDGSDKTPRDLTLVSGHSFGFQNHYKEKKATKVNYVNCLLSTTHPFPNPSIVVTGCSFTTHKPWQLGFFLISPTSVLPGLGTCVVGDNVIMT